MGRLKVTAEVTGTVWKIEAVCGTELAQDATIMLIESMKMEIPVTASDAGRLLEILVKEGELVEEGQTVAIIAT